MKNCQVLERNMSSTKIRGHQLNHVEIKVDIPEILNYLAAIFKTTSP